MTASIPAGPPAPSWTTVLDGTRLRELRRARGLSQEALADRAGISLATVARLDVRAGLRAGAGR